MANLIRLDMTVAEDLIDRVLGLLTRHVSFGWEEQSLPTGETLFRLHTDNAALLENLLADLHSQLPEASLEQSIVPNQDWTSAWREFFTPVIAGRFVVLPPWLADTPTGDRLPIVIEPKSAFGTGHHATTVLCLEAISRLLDAQRIGPGIHVLDLGTGTGVLGMACAKYDMLVCGTDIDPVAVSNAQENILINGVSTHMSACPGSVEAVTGQQYDLILANILAAPLRELAPAIMQLLKPGGHLVLSGLLTVQAADVAACYTPLGPPRQDSIGDWTSLTW